MKQLIVFLGLLVCLHGCSNQGIKSYSTNNLYNQYDLRFDEHASDLSNRVKSVLEENNWRIVYEGVQRPPRLNNRNSETWEKIIQTSNVPYEFIQVETSRAILTSNISSMFIIVSKLRDQKSAIAVTASSQYATRQNIVEPYIKDFIKQLRSSERLDNEVGL